MWIGKRKDLKLFGFINVNLVRLYLNGDEKWTVINMFVEGAEGKFSF